MFRQRPLALLLIEDAGTRWETVREMLIGFPGTPNQITAVPNEIDAVAALAAGRFDAVLVNLSSRDDAIGSIRQLCARCNGCPVVVLGPDDTAVADQIMDSGAADYLHHGEIDGPLLARALCYAVDRIADRKVLQDALAAERNLLRAVIDGIPDHIYVKDAQHRFLLANVATQKFFGSMGDALVGRSDADLFPADAASSFRWEEEQVLRSGQSSLNREERIVNGDGRQRWNLTTKVALRDKHGRVIGLVGINRDITERKMALEQLKRTNDMLARRERELMNALEDVKSSHEALQATQLQLLQVEKMESVGRLAAGIAHEVKNPLAIISTGLEYLKQSASPGDVSMGRVLGSMARAVHRADAVIRGLLDFSAPAVLRAEPCDLNSVIRQALLLVDHELMRCKVALQVDLPDNLPPVSIDANKVEQVFLNLFMNAIHAMPEGGSLTLRTRAERLAALGHNVGDLRAERFRAGDAVVVAEVDDTGHGIPEDKMPKVFDPFFTTKPTGKGTGLGLSVARTIVELHGGMLQLVNRPEGGVRALLVLKATGDLHHDDGHCLENAGLDCGR